MGTYQWKPFTLLVSAEEVKGNEMKIGDKYSFICKEIVGEMFFTDGKRYSLKSFNGNGEPVLIDDTDNDHPWSIEAFNECFKKVEEGPIRTVTRREIVAGVYGRLYISEQYGGEKPRLLIKLADMQGNTCQNTIAHGWSLDDIDEAIHTLTQVREVLEENGK